MNTVLCETNNFIVIVPDKPLVDREDGGHLIIKSKTKVKDRTELNLEQSIEYELLSEVIGKALELGMTKRGIEVGNINWQDMGNWSVYKPEGITLHMHIFGRAKNAKTQKYGEAVALPFKDTGFYDEFVGLIDDDITAIKVEIMNLKKYRKYFNLELN